MPHSLVQRAVDLEPIAAVEAHLGHQLEMLAKVYVEMREHISLRNRHQSLVST